MAQLNTNRLRLAAATASLCVASGCSTVLTQTHPILPSTVRLSDAPTRSAGLVVGRSCASTYFGIFHDGEESTQEAIAAAMTERPNTLWLGNVTLERTVAPGLLSSESCTVISGLAMVHAPTPAASSPPPRAVLPSQPAAPPPSPPQAAPPQAAPPQP